MELKHFIILDDDQISGLINEHALRGVTRHVDIRFFSDPVDCLDHIRNTRHDDDSLTCILLDINMPKLNGFEFLKELEKMPGEILSHYGVIIVTSSTDPIDREESDRHSIVRGYLTKPLSRSNLRTLLEGPVIVG